MQNVVRNTLIIQCAINDTVRDYFEGALIWLQACETQVSTLYNQLNTKELGREIIMVQ